MQYSQRLHFSEEIKCLEKGEYVSNKSKLKDLDVKFDEGVIVHQSRLRLAESVPFANPEPVILPKNDSVTDKIVTFIHRLNLHSGIETTHLLVRNQYWVIGGRKQIRKIVRTCKTPKCRPIANLAVKMAPLPADRLENCVSFRVTSTDYFGPMLIKNEDNTKKPKKCYGLLFTCFTSRAIHLELVPDLTTEGFFMGYRRFVSRVGTPSKMFSDQGRSYLKAAKELKGLYALDTDTIQKKLLEEGCEWSFSTPRAAFCQGITEAMVKCCKQSLRKVLHGALLTSEEMRTIFSEVEALVNSRPISALKDEALTPITPAELLIGRPLRALPDYDDKMENINYPEMWQRRKMLLQHFWNRWSRDYLSELSPTKKWRQKDERALNVGDVVLLRDPDCIKNSWRIARIMETYHNEKGDVTSAKIKLPGGRPLVRHLRHLAVLEADMTVTGPPTENKDDHGVVIYDDVDVEPEPDLGPRRSRRTRRVPARLQS